MTHKKTQVLFVIMVLSMFFMSALIQSVRFLCTQHFLVFIRSKVTANVLYKCTIKYLCNLIWLFLLLLFLHQNLRFGKQFHVDFILTFHNFCTNFYPLNEYKYTQYLFATLQCVTLLNILWSARLTSRNFSNSWWVFYKTAGK